MADWFKRFFLSLFSAKWVKESVRYGFGNILLTGFLSVAFIFVGIFLGGTVPFFAYYNKAEEFRDFLYNAFIEQGEGISVTVDGGAAITSGGKDVLINTFTDQADRAAYGINGYNLIVDSRNVASVYDDFTAYYKSADGSKEITCEEYLELSDKEKSGYGFAVRYSGREKEVDAADVAEYSEYFGSLPDGSSKTQFDELIEGRSDMSEREFNNSLYALYVKDCYPEMLVTVGENVPTLRNYYYGLTVGAGGYYCLFGDMQAASFNSYGNNTVVFGGVYRSGNGVNTAGLDGERARGAVDGFIKHSFYDGLSTSFVLELLNALWVIVITELIIAGAMFLCYGVGRLKKSETFSTFAKSAKAVASYAHAAAFFSALAAFCTGFALSGAAVTVAAYACFASILVIRTLTLVLTEGKTEATDKLQKD
ncbi:MAG TPA: hypothetical protein DD415_00225 [Clostridiales bacterium]|nr:hypothetical protein [Clostridiales bacterium]